MLKSPLTSVLKEIAAFVSRIYKKEIFWQTNKYAGLRIRETMMWISRLYHIIYLILDSIKYPTYLCDINEVIGKSPRIPDNPSWLKISQLFTSVIPTILATSSKLVCSKLTSLNAYSRGLITVSQLKCRKSP